MAARGSASVIRAETARFEAQNALDACEVRLAHAERVLAATGEHRCSDGVGGCTAISTSALDVYRCEYPEAHV